MNFLTETRNFPTFANLELSSDFCKTLDNSQVSHSVANMTKPLGSIRVEGFSFCAVVFRGVLVVFRIGL